VKKITLDADLRKKLLDLVEPLELCEEAGIVLGRLFPHIDLSKWELWEPPYDEEELRRLEQSPGRRYTTAEVLEHLKNLP
jgi:hypothetical protein